MHVDSRRLRLVVVGGPGIHGPVLGAGRVGGRSAGARGQSDQRSGSAELGPERGGIPEVISAGSVRRHGDVSAPEGSTGIWRSYDEKSLYGGYRREFGGAAGAGSFERYLGMVTEGWRGGAGDYVR